VSKDKDGTLRLKNIPISGIPHFDKIIINTAHCETLVIIIKGDKDPADATPSLLSEADIQKKTDYFRIREIPEQPVGKLAKNHMVRNMGFTKVYAYAGTMVYAHANSYGTVGYRYAEGLIAQRPNTDILP